MCFEIYGKIEEKMRSVILTKTKFVFMFGRTMFDIVWVNFAKNHEERRKNLPRILASHWRKPRRNKKDCFPESTLLNSD